MKLIRYSDADFAERLRELAATSSRFDTVIEGRTRQILEDVRRRGDQAVTELIERFDGAKLTEDRLAVTHAELLTASLKADQQLRQAVSEAEKNIATFAKKSLRRN